MIIPKKKLIYNYLQKKQKLINNYLQKKKKVKLMLWLSTKEIETDITIIYGVKIEQNLIFDLTEVIHSYVSSSAMKNSKLHSSCIKLLCVKLIFKKFIF